MNMALRVGVDPLFAFLRMARTRARAGMGNADLRNGVEDAQRAYLAGERAKFMSASHSAGGGEWPDLAPSTKLRRYRQAGGRFRRTKGVSRMDRLRQVASIPFPILYITGHFYSSLTPGEPDAYMAQTPDSIKVGTRVPWAHYHQTGGRRLPQRRFLHEPDDDQAKLMTERLRAGVRAMIDHAVSDASAT